MWTSLRIASLGALAQQRALDVASNNIANVNSVGFKKQRADLADVPPTDVAFDVGTEPGPLTLGLAADGNGAVAVGILTDMESGRATVTGQPLDVMINGNGFIPVITPGGRTAFTRNGALRLDDGGRLVLGNGSMLAPEIVIPTDMKSVSITPDGSIEVTTANGEMQVLARIELTRFGNPEGLVRIGDGLLVADPAAGVPISGFPGEDGLGRLSPGTLESSNVDVGEELVRMIQAQRAYQMNLRSLKAADEMLQAANNLQR
jgi:flagellar basal-body rod protein FlgG